MILLEISNYYPLWIKDLATPVIVLIGGLITTYFSYLTKTKLHTNTKDLDIKLKDINIILESIVTDVLELKIEMKHKQVELGIYTSILGVLNNSLIYSNSQKLSDYLVLIYDAFKVFVDGTITDGFNIKGEKYIISKLNSFKLSMFNSNNFVGVKSEHLDNLRNVTESDFTYFETQLLKLQTDEINNKINRFGLLAATFLQDILSITIRTYNKRAGS